MNGYVLCFPYRNPYRYSQIVGVGSSVVLDAEPFPTCSDQRKLPASTAALDVSRQHQRIQHGGSDKRQLEDLISQTTFWLLEDDGLAETRQESKLRSRSSCEKSEVHSKTFRSSPPVTPDSNLQS